MPKSDWAVHLPDRTTNSECGAPGYAPKPCGATSPGLLQATIDKNYMSMLAFTRRNSWERTFIGRNGAALHEVSRGCFESGTAHAAPCLRRPPPALRAVPLAASFFGAASKGTVFEQQGSTRGRGGGAGGAAASSIESRD